MVIYYVYISRKILYMYCYILIQGYSSTSYENVFKGVYSFSIHCTAFVEHQLGYWERSRWASFNASHLQ